MEDKKDNQYDLEFTGERYIPNDDNNSEIFMQHIQRYIVAKDLCKNKKVLDIACGEGYGSDMLAEVASSVCGVDISEEAVLHAKNKYKRDNLSFLTGSVADIPFDNESFDIIISFETIEHVSEDLQIQFLNEIKRVLKKDGFLIISSPDKLYYSDMAGFKNIYHVKELYEEEFSAILKKYFKNINMYYQGMLATSYIIDDKLKQISNINEFTVVKEHNQYDAEINIAVCSDIELPSIQNNYIADYANKYYSLKHLVNSLQNALKDPAYIIEQKENYICEQREKIVGLEDSARELNGIIEQKENYICEQREKIVGLEDSARELNGIIEQKENYICEQRELIEQHTNYIYDQKEIIGELKNIKNQQEHELNIYRGFTSNIIIKILYKIYIKMAGR